MADPAGERSGEVLRLDFDRRLMLPSYAGMLVNRELDDALGLRLMAGKMLTDARTG